MLTLAFDTSTLWGRFALADQGRVLQYRPLNVSGSYADALLVVIGEMLAAANRQRGELEAVAVTTGPGSFTGVRIGVATAKGLAWALGCRLHATTSLEAMAGALLAEHPDVPLAVPVLDARRGEIYAGVYERQGGWVRPLAAAAARPAALPSDQWWERVRGLVPDPDLPVYGGDGAGLLLGHGDGLRPELAGRGEPVLRRWSTTHPATAAALAAAVSAGDPLLAPVHPFTLVPEYLRGSDAEIKRRLDLTPATPGEDITAFSSRREEP